MYSFAPRRLILVPALLAGVIGLAGCTAAETPAAPSSSAPAVAAPSPFPSPTTSPTGAPVDLETACAAANEALNVAYPANSTTDPTTDPAGAFATLRATNIELSNAFNAINNDEVRTAGLALTTTAAAMADVLQTGQSDPSKVDLDKLATAEKAAKDADAAFLKVCPSPATPTPTPTN
ncbi:hypothetical protein D9V32_02490 [Mycetocola tolaasinivorans]|uniref:DUF732 domain-containing protein n=1 Tax=Mycetocola tolaasinivorans TaxID=76635 RepID=A0A3L7AAD1_9MICO|nr:hypothetical protein [Mycetocola tolaasinivorans]RLP77339.1 hypothetical protein D9V32_02490 [Mycetocola tolaasinivorans]